MEKLRIDPAELWFQLQAWRTTLLLHNTPHNPACASWRAASGSAAGEWLQGHQPPGHGAFVPLLLSLCQSRLYRTLSSLPATISESPQLPRS